MRYSIAAALAVAAATQNIPSQSVEPSLPMDGKQAQLWECAKEVVNVIGTDPASPSGSILPGQTVLKNGKLVHAKVREFSPEEPFGRTTSSVTYDPQKNRLNFTSRVSDLGDGRKTVYTTASVSFDAGMQLRALYVAKASPDKVYQSAKDFVEQKQTLLLFGYALCVSHVKYGL